MIIFLWYLMAAINFLKKIRQKYSFSKLNQTFHGLEKLKVLIIGETIIDRYVFCETIGKSGKEAMLVLNENSVKVFKGGAAAICNQVQEFTKNVSFFSMWRKKKILNFIKKNYQKSQSIFLKKIHKNIQKICDETSNSKTLKVYSLNDSCQIKK